MDRRYRPPAAFAATSAVLHVAALLLSGFAANPGPSVVGALIWTALAYGLFNGSRATAYLAFLVALAGISVALSIAMGAISTPVQWTWAAIVVADAFVAVTLFMLLWRPRPA
ncbi:hypothetical protein [Jannaschia sp. CCS1]|uniref:hypothetical protein n=1 Tax=Jannaschia sp. (strain CCS1) TaxID=290400 RepID=UPI000053D39B|nr:hypothetical protein [Jannaschia sp. CCS1]ABD57087.1 hypothetical protein Jann_4170 [Jannaschia sp. CCS1]